MAIILLSGERGAGKTTALQGLLGACQRAGLRPGGALQPGIFDETGIKVGSSWVDAATGASGVLGSTIRDLGGPEWKRWSFSAAGLGAANQAILAALDAGRNPVLVDEIGPLELRLRHGLYPALAGLLLAAPRFATGPDSMPGPASIPGAATPGVTSLRPLAKHPRPPCLIIAVRTDLAGELERLLPGAITVTIVPEGRAAAVRALRSALGIEAD